MEIHGEVVLRQRICRAATDVTRCSGSASTVIVDSAIAAPPVAHASGNSELICRGKLPKLPPDARARVQTAELHAIEALIQDLRAACK
jgi:hypothetical protein